MRPGTTLLSILVLCCLVIARPAVSMTLIRDAEIERTVDQIAHPILRAAGINPSSVRIYIVNSSEMNAFVAGGQNIFLYTGLLTRLETIDQLRAVIAHEVGHLAGGHQARRDSAMRGARGLAALGMIGMLAAAVGGVPDAGFAIAAGSGQVAQRNALAHSRAEEASADQAGLRFMAAAGANPAAILEVLRFFRGQEIMMHNRMDPYARTHPVWTDRIAYLEERIAAMGPGSPPSAAETYWHRRMVAKFNGFLRSPAQSLQSNPESDRSEFAVLTRAIAYHRQADLTRALAHMDALLGVRPDDPFYHELRGQMLLEAGRAAPAVESYRRAVALAPSEPLILGGLGRALLNLGPDANATEARNALRRSAELDPANSAVLRDLALAEARLGDEGAAALATAERFALEGRFSDALRHADRAATLLPRGSPGWRKAQDVITMARNTLN